MTVGSGYVLETLREGAESTLYRGRQHGNPLPLLAVALAAEQPSAQSLRRLEHECSLAADLDPAWAARPLELTRRDGRTMLILTDPGGEPLDRVLDPGQGQPLELTRFLGVAIGLAAALRQVHARGLIHKDIKPANVLVDDADHVWLTGFGIASRLPRESQPPAPPEIIAGTLAYMAPEQTGRMNRSIDTRSDLYALGVTLYEMLTGALPFSAVDPLEWVHCHIARQPTSPRDRAGVPEPLSLLTMKLLAKNAEERYQTASGVEADLRRCLAENTDLDRYIYLINLLDHNETLFYRTLMSDPARFLPIVYDPTIAEACLKFGHIYRQARGMYLSITRRGRVKETLENWPEKDVRFICVTDGGRILGLGDIGANGAGIPIGKLQLYTACAGVPPQYLLPMYLDAGTNNEQYLRDPLYLGLRKTRPSTADLYSFVDEFVEAVQEVFPKCCIHFEDWTGTGAMHLLQRYRDSYCVYNDDVQGTAGIVLTGMINATKLKGTKLRDEKYLFLGAGSAGIGLADLLCSALVAQGVPLKEAQSRVYMFDVNGLLETSRTDYAAGVQFEPVHYMGKTFLPGQANNFYIFPAIGMAIFATQAGRVTDEMFIEAGQAVADQVPSELLTQGLLYPLQANILEIEIQTAARVAKVVFDAGLARVARPAAPRISAYVSSPLDARTAVDEVLLLAREQRCGTVVVGHRAHSWLRGLGGGDLVDQLVRRAKGYAVWVIA
jgi:malic enzyme